MNIQARTWIVALILAAGAGVALAAGDGTGAASTPSGTAAAATQDGWQRGHAGPQAGPRFHGRGFQGRRFGGHGPGQFGRHRFGGSALLREIHQLNLSQAQESSIRDILKQARTQALASRKANVGSLAALANPGDPNYASAVESAKRLAAERIQARSDTQTRIYAVLTAQQKTLVSELLQNRQAKLASLRARREARRQQRGQRHHGQRPAQNAAGQGQDPGAAAQ